jgi:hypothetical protein
MLFQPPFPSETQTAAAPVVPAARLLKLHHSLIAIISPIT